MNKLTDNIKKTPVALPKSFIRITLESASNGIVNESTSISKLEIDALCATLEARWTEEIESYKTKWQEENIAFLKREIANGNQITI